MKDLLNQFVPLYDGMVVGNGGERSNLNPAFDKNHERWAKEIVRDYDKYNHNVNDLIAKIAERENLNDDQISRIIERVNNDVWGFEYNRKKGHPLKNPEFDIASLTKIKDRMNNGSVANSITTKKPGESGEEPTMKKEASTNLEIIEGYVGNSMANAVEKIAATSNGGCTGGMEIDVAAMERKLLNSKIEKVANEIVEDEKNASNALVGSLDTFVSFMRKFASYGIDPQDIFTEICKDGAISAGTQTLMCNAFNGMNELTKVAGGNCHDGALSIIDLSSINKEFSLGEGSLMKHAESAVEVPTIQLNKRTVRNISELVDMATTVQKDHEKLIKKQQRKAELQSKVASLKVENA